MKIGTASALAVPFLLILVLISSALAHDSNSSAENKTTVSAEPGKKADLSLGKDYFQGYLPDLEYILTSPVNWGSEEWLKAAAVVGTTVGLYFTADRLLQNFFQENQNGTADSAAQIGNGFGNDLYVLPALGLFYAYGYAADDQKAKRASLLAVESYLFSSLFTTALKYTTHRQRPSEGSDYDHWSGPGFSNSDVSFCSGHSSTAFSIATVFATEYQDQPYAPPLAYGLASLTALARVYKGAHWASDAFLGSAIGYFTAKTVVSLHENKGVQIVPMTNGRQMGVGVSISY